MKQSNVTKERRMEKIKKVDLYIYNISGLALHQLGKLYELMGFEEKAVKCFEETLKRKDDEQIIDKELAESLLYLARYHKKSTNFDKA